jgi:hydrogenase/urease accessory protein HupE
MSRSSSRVDVEGDVVRWTLKVQPESVLEVLPALDLDGDGVLQRRESSAGASAVTDYLADHFGLRGQEAEGSEWQGDLLRIGAPSDSEVVGGADWIEAVWEMRTFELVEGLGVRMELFEQTSPDHIDVFELRQGGELSYTALFSAAQPGAWIPDVGVGVVSCFEWFRWGVSHILSGYDHLAFLVALLLCVRGAKHAAFVVTSFTVAHSATLALAAFGVVQVSDRFVELVIALSICFVATRGLSEEPRRGLWLEAGLFGLIHGLGFAGFVKESVTGVEHGLMSLASFNLGVEVGQLAFLAPIGLGLELWRRRSSPGEELWVPLRPRRCLSVAVGGAGLYWFLLRAGWLDVLAI